MARQCTESSLSAIAVGYKPKIYLLDERRPLCLGCSHFARCFFRSAVVRAGSDEGYGVDADS
jgi:hypothetical protein